MSSGREEESELRIPARENRAHTRMGKKDKGKVMAKFLYGDLSKQILYYAFEVHNILGPGLLEKCYQEALCTDLFQAGIPYEKQKKYRLDYKGNNIGEYIADIVVDKKIILELKSVTTILPIMEAQIINYLRISRCQVGYLINFNKERVEWKRFVFETLN